MQGIYRHDYGEGEYIETQYAILGLDVFDIGIGPVVW